MRFCPPYRACIDSAIVAIFARLDLPAGARIAGPAVLEQPDATVVIEPAMQGTVDRLGNLIVESM